MRFHRRKDCFKTILSSMVVLSMFLALPLAAQEAQGQSTEDLAKAAQNPVAAMISLPFQLNATFDYGVHELEVRDTQYVMNIQPVIPFKLSENWNLISRTIVPLLSQPIPDSSYDSHILEGVGNINESLFFSPAKPGKVIWGVGPVLQFPLATSKTLGTDKYSAGPGFVVLTMPGRWVVGCLAQNLWSCAGPHNAPDVNQFLLQYFVNYNFDKGWYFTTSPVITADWEAENHDDRWTVPVGGGFGRLFRIGKQPVNCQLSYYYNLERPSGNVPSGPHTVRFQLQFLFPKK